MDTRRQVRGRSFVGTWRHVRSTCRSWFTPVDRSRFIGCRVVKKRHKTHRVIRGGDYSELLLLLWCGLRLSGMLTDFRNKHVGCRVVKR